MEKRTKTRNVILSFKLGNAPSLETLAGTLEYLRAGADWNVRLFTPPTKLSSVVVRHAEKEGVDGIITDHPGEDDVADALCRSRIPLVAIGSTDNRVFRRRRSVVFMEIDNLAVGRLGAQHLLSLGYFRSFGFLPDPVPSRWSKRRLNGFQGELKKNGRGGAAVFSAAAPEGTAAYRRELTAWLAALPKPAAVMAAADYRAVDLLEACREAEISVPEQIAVLGVDDNAVLCDSMRPTLSSVAPDFRKEGYDAAAALDRMMKRLRGRTQPTVIRFAPTRVTSRESAEPLAPGARLVERALRFIGANAAKPVGVRDVAAHLGVSASLLALRFRELQKKTVRETILDVRLEEVRRRLRTTGAPVKRIAAACGFSSANRLTHLFKAKYGLSMSVWRRDSNVPTTTPGRRL